MYSKRLLLLGLTILLLSSYVDTIRGVLLPAISSSLVLNYTDVSHFLVSGYTASLVVCLILQKICDRFPLRSLLAFFLAAGVFATSAPQWTQTYTALLALGFVLGTIVTGLGVLSNLCVIGATDPVHRSRWLCILHVMYGVGSQAAPAYVGWSFSRGHQWPHSLVVLMPAMFMALVWATSLAPSPSTSDKTPHLPIKKLEPRQILAVAVFGIYGIAEVMQSSWLVTYLTQAKGMNIQDATPWVSGFFWTLALTRLATGLLLPKGLELRVVLVGLTASMIFFVLGRMGWLWGFALAGVIGPFFPLAIARVTQRFPHVASRLVVLCSMAMSVAIGTGHGLIGWLTDIWSISAAYWIPVIALALCLMLTPVIFCESRSVARLPRY